MSSKYPPAAMAEPKKSKDKIDDWQVKDAMDTMMRAEEHKANPEMMKRVHKLAGRHVKALKGIRSVQDLKDVHQQKYGKQDPEDGE